MVEVWDGVGVWDKVGVRDRVGVQVETRNKARRINNILEI